MDSGFSISSEKSRKECCRPLGDVASRPYIPPLHSSSSRTRIYGDRFIPNRAAMDMDIAQYLLTEPRKDKGAASPAKEAYRKLLADTMLQGRTRILSFRNKTPAPVELLPDIPSCTKIQHAKQGRHIPQSAEKTLDAPDILEDYYLNLLDWGSENVLSIALNNTVYLWNATNGSASELATIDDGLGPVTSVSWAPDGCRIAIGLNSSDVQLWDATSNNLIRTLRGIHQSRVGSLAWNNSILTTGGMDGAIVNSDVRARDYIVSSFRGHNDEVCGLRWSGSGTYLASGGSDNLLHIWDLSTSNPIHRFTNHTAAVKALAWCPFQSNLLASGGGGYDRCIKFWNVNTGTCLSSVDTGSRVCSLLWNKNERELLSSHGYTENQLMLWKYPSMTKMAELTGHPSHVLFMAQSPDGCTVASAATGDETLRFWNVFGVPKAKKLALKSSYVEGPSNMYSHIR